MTEQTLEIILAGCGRVGKTALKQLYDRGHRFTVIEQDPDRADALMDQFSCSVIEGDATDPSILEQTGPNEADVFAALTSSTGVNLAASVLVQEINRDLRTIVRTHKDGLETAYRQLVDEVVYPEKLSGVAAANAIIGGGVEAFEEMTGNLQILKLTVAEGAPVAEQKLADVRLPEGSLIVCNLAGDTIASGEMELVPGNTYIVAMEHADMSEVVNLFRG